MKIFLLYVAIVMPNDQTWPDQPVYSGERYETEQECHAAAVRHAVILNYKYPKLVKDLLYQCREGTTA